jgi:hypothetical protein
MEGTDGRGRRDHRRGVSLSPDRGCRVGSASAVVVRGARVEGFRHVHVPHDDRPVERDHARRVRGAPRAPRPATAYDQLVRARSEIVALLAILVCAGGIIAYRHRPTPNTSGSDAVVAPSISLPTTCWQAHGPATLSASGHVDTTADGWIDCGVTADWTQLGTLRLHVSSDRAVTVELIAFEADRKAGFWRRLDLVAGEQDLVLPLRWFRWREGRVPRWEAVDRLAVRFRGAASVALADAYLDPGTPFLGAADLQEVAGHPLRHAESATALVLTNASDLDDTALLVHLDAVAAALHTELPFLAPPTRPVPLVVLADRASYLRYVTALGRAYNAEADTPTSDGFALQGIGLGSWDPVQGTLRPSYTHEFVHAWLAATSGLPTGRSDWVQEGMAARMQLHFHPQADFAGIVRVGLSDPVHRLPLAALLDGRGIPKDRYWQAATVLDFLFASRPDSMPALFQAMRHAGSADLLPHLGPVFGTDLVSFEEAWMASTASLYAGRGPQ